MIKCANIAMCRQSSAQIPAEKLIINKCVDHSFAFFDTFNIFSLREFAFSNIIQRNEFPANCLWKKHAVWWYIHMS